MISAALIFWRLGRGPRRWWNASRASAKSRRETRRKETRARAHGEQRVVNGSADKYRVFRTRMTAAVLFAASSAAGAAPAPAGWTLSAEAWAAPRRAETILGMPPVAAAVRALLAAPQGQLVVTHPATEEGGLWGSELRDWLVSLGIDSHRIHLQPARSTNKPVANKQNKKTETATPTEEKTPRAALPPFKWPRAPMSAPISSRRVASSRAPSRITTPSSSCCRRTSPSWGSLNKTRCRSANKT